MLFKRSFFSEFLNTTGATFTVFFTILFAVSMVQFISSATIGRVDASVVFELMLYNALRNLSPLLAGCTFIGVLVVLFRAWNDNEMVVWFTSGARSMASLLQPMLWLAVPAFVVVGTLSLVLTPWSAAKNDEVNQRLGRQDDLSLITPGRFIEASSRQLVFFIDKLTDNNQIERVFIAGLHPNREDTIWAQNARVEVNDQGDRYIVLSDGRRYETFNDSAKTRVTTFKDYGLRVDIKLDDPLKASRTAAKTTAQLFKDGTPTDYAELFWRISWPLVMVNLILLAGPLSASSPRAGRVLNVLLAIVSFIVYLSMIWLVMRFIGLQRISWAQGVILLHGSIFALIVLLYLRWMFFLRWVPVWCSVWYWRRRLTKGVRP